MRLEPEREGFFTVVPDEAGARLDVVLAARAGLSRAAAQRLIEQGRVTVGRQPARKRHALRLGEDVAWQRGPVPPSALTAEDVPYAMVYEDEWLLVVDKPAGLVVHPAPGNEHGTLAQGLVAHGAGGGHELRPGIVHRLDKDTSGLLVVAKGEPAYQALVAAMERREVKRVYVTLLRDALPQDEGTIDAPIGRHVRDRKRMSLHTTAGKPAVTHFRVLGRAPGYTLVRVQLETGRTHQIRVHFAALGYPVAGDVQYGGRERPEGLGRQFLHAAQLAFPHPEDGRQMSFASPLPPDLQAFLTGLGLRIDPRS
ncbi:MAG: RluA family pseudouridine synthase [Actinobacteria bacterium]|nr:RluA family pseudouridine synthase [Actinomycetota bacterium]